MPRVSIITPTRDRQGFLPALWECVRSQSFNDIEWLVHDDSPHPAPMFADIQDARVRYVHGRQPMSIGAKRNALCDLAQGEIIAHFDDDDFYGPNYLRDMIALMTENRADFVKLFGFFLYHRQHRVFAYWNLEADFPLQYFLSPNETPSARRNDGHMSSKWGYGFSYVFRRAVWQANPFPDRGHGEDQPFAEAAVANFRAAGKQDFNRTCLHIIHGGNTAFAFPQQLLPRNSLAHLFPDFRVPD